jgi:hypothetical protein
MKRTQKKLSLRTETVRQLSSESMQRVAGGMIAPWCCPTAYSIPETTCSTSDEACSYTQER